MSVAPEPMYDSVEHDHIESDEGRNIQNIQPHRRQGMEGVHIEKRAAVAQDDAGQQKDTPRRSTPSSEFLHGLVNMLFPDGLHNVGLMKIMPGSHAGEGNYNEQECQRYKQEP